MAIKEIHASDESLQPEIDKDWEAEAKALDEISGLNHPHIIQRIAAITRGEKHYFMFQWADGGSLRDFWHETDRPSLNAGFIKETIEQLRGLADALHELHIFKKGTDEAYRHGDLKPENILRFKDGTRMGTLKIADMGLAKHHKVATDLRVAPTSTRYGTVRYEAPEAVTALPTEARSRLYDIWSMGCIILEFMIWLLYGYEELKRFNESVKGDSLQNTSYFEIKERDGRRVAEVHHVVVAWMNYITAKDPECTQASSTAMKDLLDMVRTKLLVVPLSKRRESSDVMAEPTHPAGGVSVTREDLDERTTGPFRASAGIFRSSLDDILGKAKSNESYLFTGTKRENLQGPFHIPQIVTQDGLLSPDSAAWRPRDSLRSPKASQVGLPSRLGPAQKQNVSKYPLLSSLFIRSVLLMAN